MRTAKQQARQTRSTPFQKTRRENMTFSLSEVLKKTIFPEKKQKICHRRQRQFAKQIASRIQVKTAEHGQGAPHAPYFSADKNNIYVVKLS
jgi:hypothetical protein